MNIDMNYKSLYAKNTTSDDLDYILASEKSPENALYVGQWDHDAHAKSLDNDDMLHLTLFNRETDNRVGYIILAGLLSHNKSLELKRIVITEKAKGYGGNALRLVKDIAFEVLDFHRLWLDVRVNNHRAQGVYESIGFIKEGMLRECVLTDEGFESLYVMSIIRSDLTS